MPDDELTLLARALLRIRQSRAGRFNAGLFHGEQVWNLLLILFIADGRGERLTGRMAIEREGGSLEVGRRWFRYLTQLGYIVGDGEGHLDDPLTMTPECVHELEAWLREARDDLRLTTVDAE